MKPLLIFLKSVIINSGTMNLEGVKKVGDEFSTFQTIGFETEWIEMPKEMNRAGHLFAYSGKKGKNYCSLDISICI